ncbi:cysteine desulfurase family protein [Salsuginibacillus kocurii]|uniref:cysteine desulfurase family protein n=1 Tax=Salsuginibacillus kocurii TaxID=427078 RepID=UPI00035F7D23|nr:cysteine desulfurase family protein [Salsuginibacillus kocurii]
MVYLDNSATTKPYQQVVETFQEAVNQYYANPSSLHHLGKEAEALLHKARTAIGDWVGAEASEIIFTSGGTEGNNLAIKGIAMQYAQRGKHLITTKVEHPSVKEPFVFLEQLGFDVTYLPVDEEGRVSLQAVKEAVRKDTILVSIMSVNNELGTLQPIEEIGNYLKSRTTTHFHVDHVQGVGKRKIPTKIDGVDLCTISAHKFHGLKGTGLLYVRKGLDLAPLLHGGAHEQGWRSGTENVAGAVAMAKALRLTLTQAKEDPLYLEHLKQRLLTELQLIDGVVVNTPATNSAPHIVNISIPGLKPEVLVQSLTDNGIHVSTKSACSTKLFEPSPVLMAAGLGEELASSAIRISLSFLNRPEEIETFIDTLKQSLRELRQVMGETTT